VHAGTIALEECDRRAGGAGSAEPPTEFGREQQRDVASADCSFDEPSRRLLACSRLDTRVRASSSQSPRAAAASRRRHRGPRVAGSRCSDLRNAGSMQQSAARDATGRCRPERRPAFASSRLSFLAFDAAVQFHSVVMLCACSATRCPQPSCGLGSAVEARARGVGLRPKVAGTAESVVAASGTWHASSRMKPFNGARQRVGGMAWTCWLQTRHLFAWRRSSCLRWRSGHRRPRRAPRATLRQKAFRRCRHGTRPW
jgi:hypothetical protein